MDILNLNKGRIVIKLIYITHNAFSTLTIRSENHRSKLSSIPRRRNLVVQQGRQEIRIIFTGDLSREISSRELELVTFGCVGGE